MSQIPTKHRSDVLQELITANREKGLTEDDATREAILKLKSDFPEYFPVHRDAQGKALTLEAVVSDHLRSGMDHDRSFRIGLSDGKMARNYFDRQKVGAGHIESVFSGHLV